MSTRSLRYGLLLLGALLAAGAQEGRSILPNGDFEQFDAQGNPVGWKLSPPNSRIVAEGGNHYLVVDRKGPGVVWAEQVVPADPAWLRLRVTARVRGRGIKPGQESWQALQLGVRFRDAKGETLGYGGFTVHEDTDWKELSAESDIPTGTKEIQVYPASFGEAGEFSLDDLRLLAFGRPAPGDAKLPAGERTTWGEEPVEQLSPTRADLVLNGLWRFQPGVAGAKEPAPTGWGYLRVPGSWRSGYTPIAIPGVVAPGTGGAWDAWRSDTLNVGWYERPLRVPAEWQGRAVVLDLTRVSTDAWVYLDGREAGRVGWPGGEIDLTPLITPGREQQLRVFVAAIPAREQVGQFMGPGAGQVAFGEAKLESKGLIDDVVLHSRPRGAYVSDVFVQPSTRRKQVTLAIELTGVAQAGPVRLTARMERGGKVERTFTQTITAQAAPVQTVTATWAWPDPALWDLDRPNLYTVKLSAEGAGLLDVYAQPFGFREFWVDGRRLLLNGVELRLRPQLMPEQWSGVSGTREHVEGSIQGLRWAGFNLAELWPYEAQRRGQQHFHEVFYDAADRLGFPLMGAAGSMNDFIGWGQAQWKSPAAQAEWERLTRLELRRSRNHPSILLWASSGNSFGLAHDQHPQALGRDGWYTDAGAKARAAVLQSGLDFLRAVDPTRPAFLHQGILGDLYAVNNYLCFLPLQEREEWLSAWAGSGEKPYLAVEFGTPLSASFLRGREHFGQAMVSEPWLTEFAAIYFGPEAYRMENPAYRAAIREHFQHDQTYASWHNAPPLDAAPTAQALEDLFVRNTWRSWRTWGITAGMVPWAAAHGWETVAHDEVPAPPFQPGRRGTWTPRLAQNHLASLRPEGGYQLRPAAQALIAANGPTLAWIAGAAPAFTDKQHAYWAGQTVAKQLVLINDQRTPQPYELTWQAKVGEQPVTSATLTGTIAPAQTRLLPVSFSAPEVLAKTDGELVLAARIGDRTQVDRLSFRVFPRLAPADGAVLAFDPARKSTAMLTAVGYRVRPWDGQPTGGLLVIGREALAGGAKPPGSLEAFVRGGGRAVCFAQQPADLMRLWSLRVSRYVSRRVFAVAAQHPVVAGLDAADLRDWAGAGDLLPANPPLPEANTEPPFGWHWGNRGSVASAAVEKPHLAGWRPLLETEFDGAYTPLMELDYGRGRLILCQLDLEGRTGLEPAADRLVRTLLRYAERAPLHPRASHAVILGTPPPWFDLLGVKADKAGALPADADLAIVAADAPVDEAAWRTFVERGGKLVLLPRRAATAPLGLTLEQRMSSGSLDVPAWDIAAGLSPSDLRWRTEATAWLAASGADLGAGGQLALRRLGQGTVVWLQLDPDRFDADRATYFRFTRWRQTRAVAQVLANLGAELRADALALASVPREPDSLALAGTWEVADVKLTPPAASSDQPTPDPGLSEAARALARDGAAATWRPAKVPGMLPELDQQDGEAVVRRVVEVPAGWAGQDLSLSLGGVDDFDTTFWNGEAIGATGAETPSYWSAPRRYTVPGRLVKPGRNLLAVRIFDHYGGGGFAGRPDELSVRPAGAPPLGCYHPDYRADFILGDDPFRYKRW